MYITVVWSVLFEKLWIVIFLIIFRKNICCGYSLEVPHQGASNGYPQHKFLWRRKKNINTSGLKKATYLELWLWSTMSADIIRYINPCHAELIKMPRPLPIFSQSDYQRGRIRLIWVFTGHTCTEVQFLILWIKYNYFFLSNRKKDGFRKKMALDRILFFFLQPNSNNIFNIFP